MNAGSRSHGDEAALARLRAATSAAHRSIEAAPVLARLLADDVSLAEYVVALQVMHAFHAAVSLHLRSALQTLDAANGCDRSADCVGLLREDLGWFAARVTAPMAIASPLGVPAALGMLYVVEGSALGARVIGRHIVERFGVAPLRGGSFYDPAGRGRSPGSWERFRALLAREALTFTAEDEAALQTGALVSFAALEAELHAPACVS